MANIHVFFTLGNTNTESISYCSIRIVDSLLAYMTISVYHTCDPSAFSGVVLRHNFERLAYGGSNPVSMWASFMLPVHIHAVYPHLLCLCPLISSMLLTSCEPFMICCCLYLIAVFKFHLIDILNSTMNMGYFAYAVSSGGLINNLFIESE